MAGAAKSECEKGKQNHTTYKRNNHQTIKKQKFVGKHNSRWQILVYQLLYAESFIKILCSLPMLSEVWQSSFQLLFPTVHPYKILWLILVLCGVCGLQQRKTFGKLTPAIMIL